MCLGLVSLLMSSPNSSASPSNITLFAPRDGETFPSGNSVLLSAGALRPYPPIQRVEYYDGTNRLAASSRPALFRALWLAPLPGHHTIFAVAIDNHGGTNVSAPARITVNPANDRFAQATVLAGANISVVGGTIGATLENGEPDWNSGGGSVWYSWTARAHGRVHLTMPGWPSGTYFGTYTGIVVSNLTLVADNRAAWGGWDSEYYFEVQAGTTYHIVVAGAGGPVSPFTLDLGFLSKPANDDFEHRATIPAWGGVSVVDNSFATFQPGEPSDLSPIVVGYTASFHTVWWTWTAPVAGQVRIQPACDFLHLLGLYSGFSLSKLTPITTVFNDGATLDVPARTTLQISVDGVSGQTGVVNLNVGFTRRPANDGFEDSALAFGDKTTLQGNNTAATSEPGEPQHAGVGSGRSVWWEWVAPASGYVTLAPAPNSAAPVLAIYTGTSVSNLTAVAASAVGTVAFDAVEGHLYHIAVDGLAGWQGSFALDLLLSTIRLTEPSPGARFYPGDPIVLAATTSPLDGDGSVVDFFAGTQFLGEASRQAATFSWTNASLGTYSLTAATTDRQGTTRRSKPVVIHVRPRNDDFTNSFVLQGLNVVTNGTNLGASQELGEPTGGDPSADASVWYSWTAPVSGGVVVSLQENYFSGHPVGVYLGDSVSNLVALGESVYDFYPVNFVAHAGNTYHLEVTGFSNDPPDGAGPFTLILDQTPAPPNDDFANATVLSGTSAVVTGSNVGATSEPGEPSQSSQGIGNSVWWQWTAPARGELSLDFQGSDFDPVVSLYTGDVVSNLTLIGRAYTSFTAASPVATFEVEGGQTYHVAVVGFWYPVIAGNIELKLSFEPAPANDNFADRLPLIGLLATTTGSNTTATAEAGEPPSNGHTVWWTWTATASGPVSIGTDGSSFAPWLSVYTGTVVSNLVPVTSGQSQLTFNARAGVAYQISVDATMAGQFGRVGQIQLTLVAGWPLNDDFANRLPLSGINATAVASTVGATREALEPTHGGFSGTNSIWWTWTAPATGTLDLTVLGSGFTPTWSVYAGMTISNLSLLGDSYTWPGNVRSSGSIPVQSGTAYQIAVDGSAQLGALSAGIVTLTLSFSGLPPNDNFTNRIPISGAFVHVTGNTSGATLEPGEPEHDGYVGGHSIWWSWTAPAAGLVTLDASGSALTTLAAVYTGDTVSSLTEVAGGNASYAPVEFECTPGITYQIALDHWYADMFGAVDLKLLFSSIRLTSLTNDEVVHQPLELVLDAAITVWDGPFDQMDFLADGSVIGTATNAPYAFTWTNPPLGDHSIEASVTGSNGVTRVSPTVVIHNRPANDDFASRIPILGGSAVVHASGIGATLEPGEPAHGPVNWESVWWTWTAPADGRLTLSKPADSSFRYVLLDVYTGSDLGDLVLVTNLPANGSGTLAPTLVFEAQAGTAYQVAVAGSFFNLGDVPVTLSFASDPGTPSVIQPATASVTSAAWPVLSRPVRLSSTQFGFFLFGEPGSTYSILASTTLSAPVAGWTTIMTTNLSGGSALIQDNDATNDQRFYRVKTGR